MGQDLTPEMIDKLGKLAEKFSNPEVLRLEIESLESAMHMTKDGFDMLDRTISITELLHASETKKIDIFIDVVKYLSPIFATALITGMTVNIPNIKTDILTWIGSFGFIAMMVLLLILLSKRNRITDKQTGNYDQLNKVFSDWQKMAEVQKKISITNLDDINGEMRPIMEEFFGLQDKYKKDEK